MVSRLQCPSPLTPPSPHRLARRSLLSAVHQWLPNNAHRHFPSLQLLFSPKTPRGFGQFQKKKTSKKEGSASKSQPDPKSEAAPKSPDQSTAPKQSQSTNKETKKTSASAPADGPKKEAASKKKGKLFSSKTGSRSEGKSEAKAEGQQWFEQIPPWVYFVPIALALAFGPNIKYDASSNGITFQQFKIQLLEQGLVDHIEVVNKMTARVFLRNNVGSGHRNDLDDGATDSVYGHFSPSKVYEFNIGDIQTFEEKLEHAQLAMDIEPRDWVPVQYINEISLRDSLFSFVSSGPILTLLIFWWVIRMFRKSGAFGLPGAGGSGGGRGGGFGPMSGLFDVTKANFKVINKGEKIKTKFQDVAGLDNAKEEVGEFVHFLRDPGAYTKLGARIPKGALLSGPPGCGKTLLARAVAGEADCPFYSISGSDFVEMFVGVGPSRVRNLFEEARKNAPCIVFIDEIDAVGRKRGRGGFAGGNDERENTLNQLLVEMDGFKSDSNIVVLAGTNRADILDSALTRPGRFDRQITIDKPDIKGRIEIFKVHLRNVRLAEKDIASDSATETPSADGAEHEHSRSAASDAAADGDDAETEGVIEEELKDIDVDSTIYNDVATRMATLTPGFSGADIANVVNEAALRAARKNKAAVDISDFYEANDRVIGGLEKRISSMTLKEKEMIAHHEAGHAVAGWFLENAEPLLKVTIIPRASGALGFAQYLPKELQLYNAAQLYDMMCMALGGRAAEQIFYDRVSTGAADDLNKVTKIAYGQITIYGMNDKLGNLSFPPENNDGGMVTYRPYSEATAEVIDQEAQKLVRRAYSDTLALLTKYRDQVAALAAELMAKETIGHEDIVGVLGERPAQNDAYRAYLQNTKEWDMKYQEEAAAKEKEAAQSEEVEAAEVVAEDEAVAEEEAAAEDARSESK